MKVFYHKMNGGNVGDDMNATLWHRVLPELDELTTAAWLIGAGTIVDSRLNALHGPKIVMGSGVRLGAKRVAANGDVRFAAVRGYLSAAACGLEPSAAVCDPGFLVASVWPQDASRGEKIGFVPHVYSERYSSIVRAAADVGFEVISPTLDIERFLQALARCARVYTESLHGAIFADALRIPWARVCACSIYYEGREIADFKWSDAFSVVGLRAEAINRVGLLPIKRSWSAAREATRPLQALAERRLVRALNRRRDDPSVFQLSDAARLQERIDTLLARVQRLRSAAEVEKWPAANRDPNAGPSDTRPLRVCAFPKQNENAYLANFSNSLEARGALVDDFTFVRANRERYDIVHMHWPDTHLRTHSWWRAIGKHVRLGLTCALLRARGTRIVWMIHNLKPHEKDHWISRSLFPLWFPRACTNVMALTHKGLQSALEMYPALRSKPAVVVPHGHYRNVCPPPRSRASAREALGLATERFTFVYFGNIRRYKNVPLLIRTFRALEARDAQLLVAGRPVLGMRASDLEALAAGDDRIHLHLEFIPDDRLGLYLSAADKIVIPFDSVLNSGSVMHALSMNRSVLAPRLGALPELQAHVGRRWLQLYDGSLTPELMRDAMNDPERPGEHERPDLSHFDWDDIARTTLHFYRHSRAPSEGRETSSRATASGEREMTLDSSEI
ncbi:MAG: glycosyltransferase [Xanthomonadaceae bacterium]|nr:glycosyltransferase [Xanthomonadaceae bacterium]